MRIVFVLEQDTGCAWYRCRVPGSALESVGHEVTYATDTVPVAPTTVFLRPSRREAPCIIADIVQRGRKAIVEIDDDLWSIARDNAAYPYWNGQGVENLKRLEACIRAASSVTVSTEALANVVRGMNPHVTVIPNMLPEGWHVHPPHESVTVGWAGSATHKTDIALLSDVLRDTPADVALVGAGGDWTPYSPRIQHWAPVALPDMPALIGGFDIGLAPLVDTRFNRAKSDIKVLEYAACGLPVIASPQYAHTPARIARNYKDWNKHLRALLASPGLREAEGARMLAWAQTRLASRHVAEWEAAWSLTR